MSGFKEPSFADRQKAAQQAKQDILNKFRAKPGPDDPEVKQRQAEREAQAAARAKVREAREAAKAEQKAREAEAAALAAAQVAREKEEETARLAAHGKTARIFNLGCGPAQEIQDFLVRYGVSDHARFTLLDFNEETIRFATSILSDLKNRHHRGTSLDFVKKSVGQVLKGRGRKAEGPGGAQYDFVYCAGLFDYLNDRICKSVLTYFYDIVAPGGLVVATNVEGQHPIRNIMEYMFEWHLVYRNSAEFASLVPERAPADSFSIQTEDSAGNIFLEIRKPLNGNGS